MKYVSRFPRRPVCSSSICRTITTAMWNQLSFIHRKLCRPSENLLSLKAPAEYRDWIKVFSREYLRLQREVEQGKQTFLDDYGATDEAEFFAVATEQFFDQPVLLRKNAPDLYRVLKEYYRQD